jgi:hypothetical protein
MLRTGAHTGIRGTRQKKALYRADFIGEVIVVEKLFFE